MPEFTLDPYEGKTLPEMKRRAHELCVALSHWQMTTLLLAEKHGTRDLPIERAIEVDNLIHAYKD